MPEPRIDGAEVTAKTLASLAVDSRLPLDEVLQGIFGFLTALHVSRRVDLALICRLAADLADYVETQEEVPEKLEDPDTKTAHIN